MNLKEWQKYLKSRKSNIADGIVVAYDIDGKPLGEVEYKVGKVVRRTKYSKRIKKSTKG